MQILSGYTATTCLSDSYLQVQLILLLVYFILDGIFYNATYGRSSQSANADIQFRTVVRQWI